MNLNIEWTYTYYTSPPELIICKINSEEDSFILAFTYRSPNSSNENFKYFNNTLKCLSDNFPSNLLVIGDLNYPKIEWGYYTSKSNDTNFKFIKCIRDCLFERGRGANNALLLDLVLTKNNDFIDNVSVKAPLGKSDHSFIDIVLQNHPSLPSYTEMWVCSKADFEKIKELFNEEFNTSIKNCTDVESQYATFHSALNQAKKDFIPKKVLKPNFHNHHVQLNGKAKAMLRKKHRP